jgi:hypothetical protein
MAPAATTPCGNPDDSGVAGHAVAMLEAIVLVELRTRVQIEG